MLTQEKRSITLELKNAGTVSPIQLVAFSPEYIDHTILLKKYIAKNIGKTVNLLTARMNTRGELGEMMEFSGLAKEINGNLITIESAKDPVSKILSDELHNYVIRTDSVLGVLPFLPSGRNIQPFVSAENETSLTFLDFIKKSRNHLRTCINVKHHVKLVYQVDDESKEKIITCEIIHVNTSNLEVKKLHEINFVKGKIGYVNPVPQNVFLPFRTDTEFLKKITINEGSKFKPDPHDDGEIF